jgi:hypothetical protein
MQVVATTSKQSALANLASSFHQDFILTGVAPEQWGKQFIKRLSIGQRRVLRVELLEFLGTYPGASAKGIRNAWVGLGADGWPRSANLRETMALWIKALE